MKLKELVDELLDYNPEAEVNVVAHCREYPFTLSCGGGEGTEKHNCETLSFYVDDLCTNETQNNKIPPIPRGDGQSTEDFPDWRDNGEMGS